MKGTILVVLLMTFALFAWSSGTRAQAAEGLPSKAHKSCIKCHKFDKQPNTVAGRLAGVSKKAKTIQLDVGKVKEVIYFDDQTVLKNAPSMKKIKTNEAVKIVYYQKDGKNFAKEVEVKKGLKVPKEKLASVEEVAKLVALGPEKGDYVLLDSRPPTRYNEGHIPTAKSLLFFKFDKLKDKILPKDKDTLQIYYCGGFT